MMFEDESETVGTFDAKGVETVRRDGCGAVSKVCQFSDAVRL